MLQLLLMLFIVLSLSFVGTYLSYFAYMWKCAKKPWKLKTDRTFQPKITILIPTYNEAGNIESKLRNIKDLLYPKEKIEIIVVDDASEDETLEKAAFFMQNNPDLKLTIVKQDLRVGKSAALNKALDFSTSEIVIVSDADTLWPQNVLIKALPYLADPTIGAVTGKSINKNAFQSWVTKSENVYLSLTSLLRLGESKLHSTIRFEGGFCVYKRSAFKKFDCETGSDDSGTALEVIQNGFRAIMVPEAVFYTDFPANLQDKLKIKTRRANQLIGLWVKCLRLLVKSKLRLPKRIALPEILLFIFNPISLMILIVATLTLIVLFPLSSFSIGVLLLVAGLLVFARKIFLEVLLDNLILFYALVTILFGRKYITWGKD